MNLKKKDNNFSEKKIIEKEDFNKNNEIDEDLLLAICLQQEEEEKINNELEEDFLFALK